MIEITPDLALPETEIAFSASRSSGPGGQNVNKVESRVALTWDVGASPSLDENQRRRLRERLATRISKQGLLRVVSQRHRTQAANREAALLRFRELVASALAEEPPRKPRSVSPVARRRRLEEKRRQGEKKRRRKSPELE